MKWSSAFLNQMSEKFRRFLSIGSVSEHVVSENLELDRVIPSDLNTIHNLSDYDNIIINLSALCERKDVYDGVDVKRLFDPVAWRDVLLAGGRIIVIGDPDGEIDVADFGAHEKRQKIHDQIEADAKRAEPTGSSMPPGFPPPSLRVQRLNPLTFVLLPETDRRPIDYRRVPQSKDKAVQTWLDSVLRFEFSWRSFKLSNAFASAMSECARQSQSVTYGSTSFQTNLAVAWRVHKGTCDWGWIIFLPPTYHDCLEEEHKVFKLFFDVKLGSLEPEWAARLKLPGQAEIVMTLSQQLTEASVLQEKIRETEVQLSEHKRWFRLLYADGGALEGIVKEALEKLGATVVKKSKEKDDFRVSITGHLPAVMEIKGTHNAQFNKGAIRQLAGWMDEAIAEEPVQVKGIFIGNNGRHDDPAQRSRLVEHNIEGYAKIKDIVLLRSVDLYCVLVLLLLKKMDAEQFWKRVFLTKGLFDAADYWKLLPDEFAFSFIKAADGR